MDIMTFIRQSYSEVYDRIVASCQGLTHEDLLWRPAPHANPIAFMLWHTARHEDRTMRAIARRDQEVWVAERWYERFGHPVGVPGVNENANQRDTLPFPELDVLMGYFGAVHRTTLECLEKISPDDFGLVIDPAHPERTVGARLRHLTVHASNHHGQLDYVKGLMHPGWNLTGGTGIKQD